jgi:phosphoribosylglycinamide formyltransferase 1
MITAGPLTRVGTSNHPLRVVVLASGAGSNFQALIDAQERMRHVPHVRLAGLLCNVEGAGALARARAAKIPFACVPHQGLARDVFERKLLDAMHPWQPELLVLAGFMRVITSTLIDVGRPIINVHPALLPSFPGMHGAAQAIRAGVRISGCTVHLVDGGVDTGTILAQAAVPVLHDDTEETLQQRIQREEHRLLPAVVAAIGNGSVYRDVSGRVHCPVC